jgi:hypothetical protein
MRTSYYVISIATRSESAGLLMLRNSQDAPLRSVSVVTARRPAAMRGCGHLIHLAFGHADLVDPRE